MQTDARPHTIRIYQKQNTVAFYGFELHLMCFTFPAILSTQLRCLLKEFLRKELYHFLLHSLQITFQDFNLPQQTLNGYTTSSDWGGKILLC